MAEDQPSPNTRMIEERLLRSETDITTGFRGNVWIEWNKIWRIAFPAMLTRISTFGVLVVTQAFIGHIGATYLAAYAFIQILGVRFVNGILIGMSSATETLCGQAFGAKQYHMLGIYLQRSWIVNFITATIFVPLFCFATPILKLIGEDEDIAEAVESIALWFIPVLYSYVFSYTIMQYLQSQSKNLVLGWLSMAAFILHVFLSWLFVYILNWGVSSAMIAMGISTWAMMIGLFIYIFGGWCPGTWNGFTFAAFKDLWPVMKLSVSSGIMQCLELWYTAILVLLAGYMPNASIVVSAFSICVNMVVFVFMICLGFQASVSVRVSNELGEGNARAAQFSVKVNLATSISVGVLFSILCHCFSHQLSQIFTDDEAVVNRVYSLSTLLTITILVYSAQPVLCGVAIGSGRQTMAAWVNFVSFYILGIPLGVLLAYVFQWEVKGMWIGLLMGLTTQTIVLGIIVWRTNWQEQVEKALERLNRFFLREPWDDQNGDNSTQKHLNVKISGRPEDDAEKPTEERPTGG